MKNYGLVLALSLLPCASFAEVKEKVALSPDEKAKILHNCCSVLQEKEVKPSFKNARAP